MVLDYYYSLHSAPCRGPISIARALGIVLNLKKVDLFKKEQMKPEFLKINPEHTIPTLVDGDFVLWESKAIIGYLVGKYGKNDTLYPLDPQKRAIIDRMFYFDMDLHQKFRNWARPVMREGKIPDDAKLEEFHKTGLAVFNSRLDRQKTDFVTGNELCAADYTLANAIATYIALGVDMSRHPAIEAWLARCASKMAGYQEIVLAGAEEMAAVVKPMLMKK